MGLLGSDVVLFPMQIYTEKAPMWFSDTGIFLAKNSQKSVYYENKSFLKA